MDIYHMSFSSSMLIVFILLLKAFSGYKLPRKTFTLLWKIVLVRLMIPFTIKIPLPDFLVNTKKKVSIAGNTLMNLALTGGPEGTEYHAAAGSYRVSGAYILTAVWIVIALILFCIFLLKYRNSRRKVNEALPSENTYANNWLSRQDMIRQVRILTFDRIESPVTIGVLNPKIILPKNMEMDRGRRLEYVLSHEMVHIKRFDIVWKLLSMIILCLNWFNPLVWLMYKQFNQDIEMACDEKVIKIYGNDAKPDYAYAIIQLMERKPNASLMYSGFGQKPVEERIKSIMKLGNPTKKSIAVSITVILMSTMAFFTTVAAADEFGAFELPAVTGGETGTAHAKNAEAVKYFPVNKNGYTYGSIDTRNGVIPDLINIDKVNGYVYADEYINVIANSKASLDVQNIASDKDIQQEIENCNVYLSDGETIIGTYNFKNMEEQSNYN